MTISPFDLVVIHSRRFHSNIIREWDPFGSVGLINRIRYNRSDWMPLKDAGNIVRSYFKSTKDDYVLL